MRPSSDSYMSANMVLMLRATLDGAIWLADDDEEGRFYEHLAHKNGRVVCAFGGAVEVLETVMARGMEGVLAVVRSGERLQRSLPAFRPDLGDAASMLLCSNAARVLGEVAGPEWLLACERDVGGILPRAVHAAKIIAVLRSGHPMIPFGDLLEELIDWRTAAVNWAFIENGGLGNVLPGDLISRARQVGPVGDMRVDLLECDGMDAVAVLAAATRRFRPRGIAARSSVSSGALSSLLRSSFGLEEVEKDGLYWRLKKWQWQNYRYGVFCEWRKLDNFEILLDQSYVEKDFRHLIDIAGPGSPMAFFQLDLDNFKKVNDVLGHAEGDEAIKLCERRLLAAIRGRGEAYKRGGDELVGFMIDVTIGGAAETAEKLRADIEMRFRDWSAERGLSPAPTASIGVVHCAGNCRYEALARELDAAQMRAKRLGKNRVVLMKLDGDKWLEVDSMAPKDVDDCGQRDAGNF